MDTVSQISQAIDRVTVDFFTGSYRFSASVIVNKYSLINVLRDKTTNHLNLADVYISPIDKPSDMIGPYPRGAIAKDEISFILLPRVLERLGQERLQNQKQLEVPVFITLPFFEIQGLSQWRKGDQDVKKLLLTDTQKFIPILQAKAQHTYLPTVNFQSSIILVNQLKVELLCIDDA